VATAQQEANRLVHDERVAGLVIAETPAVVTAVSRQNERQAVPLVDACSSADNLTDLGLDWYYRIGPTDRRLAEATFALLRQQQGDGASIRRLTTLEGVGSGGANAPGGSAPGGPATVVKDLADRAGYEIGARLPLGPSTSAAELADRLNQSRPDAVVAVVSTDQEAAVVSDLAQRLKNLPVLAVGRGIAGVGGSTAGNGPGLLRTVGWSGDLALRSPTARAVVELYRQRYGSVMSEVAADVFTATLTLAAAVDGAASTDAARVRGALRQLWLPATKTIMPWNGIRFDNNGQNSLAAGVIEQRGPDGFQVVYPRELAAATVTWRR
jgi:branched-chain amino acid transport system substrate-binding protein